MLQIRSFGASVYVAIKAARTANSYAFSTRFPKTAQTKQKTTRPKSSISKFGYAVKPRFKLDDRMAKTDSKKPKTHHSNNPRQFPRNHADSRTGPRTNVSSIDSVTNSRTSSISSTHDTRGSYPGKNAGGKQTASSTNPRSQSRLTKLPTRNSLELLPRGARSHRGTSRSPPSKRIGSNMKDKRPSNIKRNSSNTSQTSISGFESVRQSLSSAGMQPKALIDRTKHTKEFKLNRPNETSEILQIGSFQEMKLHPLVHRALSNLGLLKPSPIQKTAIPTIIRRQSHVLCGSQTGTGKTISYLVPLFHLLKMQETLKVESEFEMVEGITEDGQLLTSDSSIVNVRQMNKPRSIIVVPSRYLVEQVTTTAKLMAHDCKLRVVGLHSRSVRTRDTVASGPIDILVTTPFTLCKLIEGNLSLSQCIRMVLDEADTLFDRKTDQEKDPQIVKIIENLKKVSKSQHKFCPVVMVTATFPVSLSNAVSKHFPNAIKITTDSLHKTPLKLKQQFMLVGSSDTKQNMLLETIKRATGDTSRILVFCNRAETVMKVTCDLQAKSIDVVALCSTLERDEQQANMKRFLKPGDGVIVCVATDIASRGIDTKDVGHVILYEFPHTSLDYLHRVGRTARFGTSGRATSLLSRRDVKLAELIQKQIGAGVSIS